MSRHLGTLSILHYVYGGFICFGGVFALLFVFLGGFLGSDLLVELSDGAAPPEWLGSAIQVFGAVLFVLIEVWGMLTILAGKWISELKHRTATMVIAGLNCLHIPFGIALGIFTLVVLSDEEVQSAFADNLHRSV